MKHKSTQPLYIFNRENPQNSEPQNGPRSGLDYIALAECVASEVNDFIPGGSSNTGTIIIVVIVLSYYDIPKYVSTW